MSLQPTFTVRIRTEQAQDMDWMVQPDQITFHQALIYISALHTQPLYVKKLFKLYGPSFNQFTIFPRKKEVISRVLPQVTVTAFEYEDEDGDRITVRSDEEMKSMFESYFNLLSEEDFARGLLPPLIIFPRVGKTPQNRNKFGLKIKTDKQSISRPSKPVLNVSDVYKKNKSQNSAESMEYTDTGQPPGMTSISQDISCTTYTGDMGYPHGQTMHPTEMGYQPGRHTFNPAGHQPDIVSQVGHKPIRTSSDLRQLLATQDIAEDHLQVLNMIGKGNVGCVYRALHKPTQTIMAVKRMQLDVSVEEQGSILSELDILNKCNSPVIIGFYKAFFVENRISILTEYMDGGSLDKYGQIPEHILGRMAVAMAEGLCYMSALKILHRDIKPSNVLVNTQGHVKLCDFGVSTQLVKSIAKTYIGTNAYMAPERMRGEVYSSPAEIWSFGITLFELATGRFPYDNASALNLPMALLNRVTSEPVPKLPDTEFSPDFIEFIARCMQPEPGNRLKMEQLSLHSFIQRHNDRNLLVIAEWIKDKLSRRQSPQWIEYDSTG